MNSPKLNVIINEENNLLQQNKETLIKTTNSERIENDQPEIHKIQHKNFIQENKRNKNFSKNYLNNNYHNNYNSHYQNSRTIQHFSNNSKLINNNRYVNNQNFNNNYRTKNYSFQNIKKNIINDSKTINNYINNYSNLKKKKIDLNEKELKFIFPYEKTKNYSNFEDFDKLNLKFLKQNYKFKEEHKDSFNNNNNNSQFNNNNNNLNVNNNNNNNLNNNLLLFNQLMMNHSNNNNNNNNTLQNNNNSTNNNNNNNKNVLLKNILLQNNLNQNNNLSMNMNNISNLMYSNNNNNNNMRNYYNMFLKQQNNINNNNNNNNNNQLMQFRNYLKSQQIQQQIIPYNNNQNIQNMLGTFKNENFIKPYNPLLLSTPPKILPSVQYYFNNSLNNIYPYSTASLINQNKNQNFNNENVYSYLTEKKIEENKKSGKFITGIIRMNKTHNHGYITVPGLENDILIRGRNNLNQCLNLDEVLVELLPIKTWKFLYNKKIRKITNNNNKNDVEIEDNNINNINNNNNEIENDTKKIDDDNNNNNNNNNIDDDEELMKNGNYYLDEFTSKEERFKYINKLSDLRPEGKIVKILNSPNMKKNLIAKIEIDKEKEKIEYYATCIDETIPKIYIKNQKFRQKSSSNSNLSIEKKLEENYYKNKYFLINITGWQKKLKCHKGIIVNEIGECGDIEVESQVLLHQYNIEYTDTFSENQMKEIQNKISNTIINEEFIKKNNRLDLTNELVFTIDPYTSKDLDDSISVKIIDKEKNLLEIGVHIADPSFYVEKNSLIDEEALKRVTTIYLVQKNIPMLPRILSEDVCSILPNKNSLAISCIFRIYLNGSLDENFKPKFVLSVVNSKAKWNYDLVQKIIEDKNSVKYDDLNFEDGTKPKNEQIFNEMVESIEILYKLTKLVRQQRFESGSIMINNDNILFKLDENNLPIEFKLDVKNDSHNLIEELMLIANQLCAKFLYENMKKYALIRRHPYLNDNKSNEIQRYLFLNKINIDLEEPQELNKFLIDKKKNNLNEFLCIQHKLKTFFLRAEYVIAGHYDFDELKHYALNFSLYTHFTSPIRRYPDIIVHRQIKEIINYLNNKENDNNNNFKEFEQYASLINKFNEKYNNGKLISQKSQKIFQYIYIKMQREKEDKENIPHKKYTALIMDINDKSNKRNQNNNNSSNNDIVVNLLINEMNLEADWKKEYNENVINCRLDKDNNELIIDYKTNDGSVKNKSIKTFDSLLVDISIFDSLTIDVKCVFDLN